MLQECINFCRQYAHNKTIVYKSCSDYIIVLRKLTDTITNESRDDVIDPQHAYFEQTN
jgi:hypothetical protein